MPYFKYNEKSCYYEEHGDGIPLLFLHGNTASSKMFCNVVEPFAKHYKVVLIDFLGHGKSDRVEKLETDLWFDEALQVIAFLEQAHYKKANLIGSSGGALVAINVALERSDLVDKVIADSFEGEVPLQEFVQNVVEEREMSKKDKEGKRFYYEMHGEDWENVVDNDTNAIYKHAKTIGKFFHKPLNGLQTKMLLTGSKEDEYVKLVHPDFYIETYSKLIGKLCNASMHIFDQGRHPALLSNKDEFVKLAKDFFDK
ncbi:alpha/beta fold hydrolase [Geosporobacter ferrireducens]|uniref:Alpha/beta hydrolase n=1 Tax=Geosporobacter ferrireducens TaxID=1424294 RepID=A0A1D8GNN1_9FIRM|nr:alpha/beta hydrolase [Geosporobacter ferrireducens]AOT72467.1 alpha/beta hydrolase [Geosporobacter ferrireducens]MTI56268.1 alpha/beta hydrolase [Geosporobacter ferrireducens]